jgi:hypothetical protein
MSVLIFPRFTGHNKKFCIAKTCAPDILFRPDIEDTGNGNSTVIFECTSCLTGVEHLYGLATENLSYVKNLLLYLGTLNGDSRLEIGRDEDFNETSLVSKVYENPASASIENAVNLLGDLPYSISTTILHQALLSQNTVNNTDGGRTAAYALNAAHQVARLPILTILGAEQQLPTVNEKAGDEPQTIVIIELGVQWERVYTVLGSILGGQLLAIAAATFVCRGVPLQDPQSYLSVASLLRHAAAVADSLGSVRIKLRYGAKKVDGCDGTYEIGLWAVEGIKDDVVEGFPPGSYVTGLAMPDKQERGPLKRIPKRANTT